MELTLNFDTTQKADLALIRAIGAALQVAGEHLGKEEDSAPVEKQEVPVDAEESPKTESAEEAPAPAAVGEAPKKRTRRKKEELKSEPVQEELPLSGTSDLPFDNEPEPEKPAEAKPAFPTMSKDEWTEVNQAKRKELGLFVGGEHSDLIRAFNTYCQKNSDMWFGTPKPSTLSAEELWQFADWFKTIQMNPDYIPGSADEEHGCPFVSSAHSKKGD